MLASRRNELLESKKAAGVNPRPTKAKLAIKRLNDKRRFYYEQPKISDKLIHYRIYNKHTVSFFWLFIPCIILLIVGIFVKPCLYVGLALLLIDILLSLIEQFRIRQAFLKEGDNPDFQAFQDALSKDGNWRDNIGELLNQKISNPQNEIKSHDESEDK